MPDAQSIPQSTSAHKPQPVLPRRLRRWLAHQLRWLKRHLSRSARACNADRYRKHFHSWAHFVILLFHALTASDSLRQTHAAFAQASGLAELAGLEVDEAGRLSVSLSQLADSNHTRPAEFVAGLVGPLLERLRASNQLRGLPPALVDELVSLDTTFVRISLKLASWLPKGTGDGHTSAVRVQIEYAPASDLPEHVLLGTTNRNDCQGLDEAILDNPERLGELAGRTLVFDLGYYSHRRIQALVGAGVHVVTRLNCQAKVAQLEAVEVQAQLPELEHGRIEVVCDERVTLGSPNNRAGAVLPGMRLVRAVVQPLARAQQLGKAPVQYELVTDRWDLTAQEVVQCYLYRWQVELFFRWLKSNLKLCRLLGYSPNAVSLSVWLALIAHLLTVLAASALGHARRSPALLKRLGTAMLRLDRTDLDAAEPPVSQLHLLGFTPHPAPT